MKVSRRWLNHLCFTAVLLALVIGAAQAGGIWYRLFVLAAMLGSVATFLLVFPGSHFFTIALANYITAYICLFSLFIEVNFDEAPGWSQSVGFALPLIGFVVGALWKREAIASVIASEDLLRRERSPSVLGWLIPVSLVGFATFLVPSLAISPAQTGVALIGAMAAVTVFVTLASRTICVFLINTGLLFEDFFRRLGVVAVPIFAFVTFYTMIVIVFAAVYRILDRLSSAPPFLLNGEPGHIDFLDALYFSLITLSTVGYGDIAPADDLVRMIASAEIVLGVLLLLFGFAEIRRFSLEHPEHGRR